MYRNSSVLFFTKKKKKTIHIIYLDLFLDLFTFITDIYFLFNIVIIFYAVMVPPPHACNVNNTVLTNN